MSFTDIKREYKIQFGLVHYGFRQAWLYQPIDDSIDFGDTQRFQHIIDYGKTLYPTMNAYECSSGILFTYNKQQKQYTNYIIGKELGYITPIDFLVYTPNNHFYDMFVYFNDNTTMQIFAFVIDKMSDDVKNKTKEMIDIMNSKIDTTLESKAFCDEYGIVKFDGSITKGIDEYKLVAKLKTNEQITQEEQKFIANRLWNYGYCETDELLKIFTTQINYDNPVKRGQILTLLLTCIYCPMGIFFPTTIAQNKYMCNKNSMITKQLFCENQ